MQTTVNYISVRGSLSELNQTSQKLSSIISDAQAVYRSINYCTGIARNTATDLQRAILNAKENNSRILQLCSVCEKAMLEYSVCESRLAGNDVSAICSQALSTASELPLTDEVEWGPLISVIGQFGTVGGLASALFGIADNPENIGNSIAKLVGSGAKLAGRIADGKLIDIWGTSTVDAIGFSENIAKELDGYIINNSYNSNNMSVAAKNASNVSAVAKWSGIVISGMLNFANNVEEYNADFSNPRLYAETIGETAVDFGLGIAVGAGVAALAGATAPVWAVGVVSTGVVLGLDWVSKKLKGKEVSELVSDAALDIVETTGKAVKKAAEFVGDAVSATADRISAGWKKFKSLF